MSCCSWLVRLSSRRAAPRCRRPATEVREATAVKWLRADRAAQPRSVAPMELAERTVRAVGSRPVARAVRSPSAEPAGQMGSADSVDSAGRPGSTRPPTRTAPRIPSPGAQGRQARPAAPVRSARIRRKMASSSSIPACRSRAAATAVLASRRRSTPSPGSSRTSQLPPVPAVAPPANTSRSTAGRRQTQSPTSGAWGRRSRMQARSHRTRSLVWPLSAPREVASRG